VRAVHATEGWGWAKTARRRFAEAGLPADGPFEQADRTFDLAQGVEALDRAFRSAQRVLDGTPGTSLPDGVDWDAVRSFVRRSRDALAHGDERLAKPGYGYLFRCEADRVTICGKAKGEKSRRSDSIPLADLESAATALEAWLDRESSIP
jgi:hypothetical protein